MKPDSLYSYDAWYSGWRDTVERRLLYYIDRSEPNPGHRDDCPSPDNGGVYIPMRYSLLAGGKRLRPVISMAVCKMAGGCEEDVLPYACAVEMIHTYSLIHDDLPSMDNDDYRRGMPSCHKKFGEAVAILAGDALLNLAFEIMLDDIVAGGGDKTLKAKAASVIARASGAEGMVGGQMEDISYETSIETDKNKAQETEARGNRLKLMHSKKTGMIINAAAVSSALISGMKDKELKYICEYSESLGLAFQIKDDILDIKGNMAEMGKKTGKDELAGKLTYTGVYGLDIAEKMLLEQTRKATGAAANFGSRGIFLSDLAIKLLGRNG